MSKKLTYKYVKNYFEKQGCELLESEYKNNRTKMKYICNCGDVNKIRFDHFRKGQRCSKCAHDKTTSTTRHSFEYIYDFFQKNGCKLLETTYKNVDIKLKYKCNCGSIDKIRFDHFKNGTRCMKCASKKRSGANNGNYNPNLTDEERKHDRRYGGYKEWRRKVYKKYRWTCQKCGVHKKIHAHHIKGYADNKELRTRVSNGIVLCQTCHYRFHSIYGKKNNQEQLDEYLKTIVS